MKQAGDISDSGHSLWPRTHSDADSYTNHSDHNAFLSLAHFLYPLGSSVCIHRVVNRTRNHMEANWELCFHGDQECLSSEKKKKKKQHSLVPQVSIMPMICRLLTDTEVLFMWRFSSITYGPHPSWMFATTQKRWRAGRAEPSRSSVVLIWDQDQQIHFEIESKLEWSQTPSHLKLRQREAEPPNPLSCTWNQLFKSSVQGSVQGSPNPSCHQWTKVAKFRWYQRSKLGGNTEFRRQRREDHLSSAGNVKHV